MLTRRQVDEVSEFVEAVAAARHLGDCFANSRGLSCAVCTKHREFLRQFEGND